MIHTYIVDIRNLSYPVRRELSESLDRQAFLISPTPSSISVTHESLALLHSAEAYAASVSLDARLAEAVLNAVPADILGNPFPLYEFIGN